MEVPKEGFIRRYLKYGYVPYVEPESLLSHLKPDQYKVIGLPKKKDYDGDNIRRLYYIGIRKGKLVFHTSRGIWWKRQTTLAKLDKKLCEMFGASVPYIQTDHAIIKNDR